MIDYRLSVTCSALRSPTAADSRRTLYISAVGISLVLATLMGLQRARISPSHVLSSKAWRLIASAALDETVESTRHSISEKPTFSAASRPTAASRLPASPHR